MPESSQQVYPIILLLEATVVAAQTAALASPDFVLFTQPKTCIAGVGLVIATFIAISIRTWQRLT